MDIMRISALFSSVLVMIYSLNTLFKADQTEKDILPSIFILVVQDIILITLLMN